MELERTPGGAIVMDGKLVRDSLIAQVRQRVADIGNPDICLATVLVGDDKPSKVYVGSKQKKAVEAGLKGRHVELPQTATQAEVEETVRKLVADPAVHGILVQLPLPDGLDPEPVLDLIPPAKDVDGLTERSMGRLVRGKPGHVGAHSIGVMRLLEHYDIPTSGQRRSWLAGPRLLDSHSPPAGPQGRGRHGDVGPQPNLGSGCRVPGGRHPCRRGGMARLITADHVKPGATVLDVGVSRTEAGIVGDVDFDAVQEVAGAITPMPGGTGPMTIASLMENTFNAYGFLQQEQ